MALLWQLQPLELLNLPLGWPSITGAVTTNNNSIVNASVPKRLIAMLRGISISYFGYIGAENVR